MKKFNALIVDNDITSRMRLKQATSSVVEFGTVTLLNTPAEALSALSLSTPIDVVFVSWRLGSDVIRPFIQKAKETVQGQDAAYIAVMKSAAEGNASVAQVMMDGADGILCEPFSVDQLVEITRLSTKVKGERFEARERAALSLLIPDIIKQLDLVAHIKSSGLAPETSLKVFRELCQKVKERDQRSHSIYYELALTAFENAPVPHFEVKTKTYVGVSSRVKRRMEQKMQRDLLGKV
jgi:DNA-binding NarL/FixJ family response regulator